MTEGVPHFPPISPGEEEEVLPRDLEYENGCLSSVSGMTEKLKYQFKNSLLTRSQKWGLVWRVDFVVLGSYSYGSNSINRMIFFRLPNAAKDEVVSGMTTAFGQRVKPL